MGLLELRILLVVILCVPVVLLGIRFIGSLTDAALSGRKIGGGRKKRKRNQRNGRRRKKDEIE